MAAVKKYIKSNGYGEKQTVRVITVDKVRRRVECAMRDGAMVWAAIWETDTVFRWPNVGEIWTIRKDTGVWRLDQIVQSTLAEHESEATPKTLKELPEGDTRIMGKTVHVKALNADSITVASGSGNSLYINVKDHGALGDGVTDDTLAIQKALDLILTIGQGTVFVPAGTYVISGLRIHSNTTMIGAGWTSIFKVITETTNPYPIRNDNYKTGDSNITVRDFAINGNKGNIAGDRNVAGQPDSTLIFLAQEGLCHNINVERIHEYDAKRLGIVFMNVEDGAIRNNYVRDNGRDGITVIGNSKRISIEDNIIAGCGDDHIGLNSVQAPGETNVLKDILVIGNTLIGPGDDGPGLGVTIRGGEGIRIENMMVTGIEGWAVGIFDAYAIAARNISISNVTTRFTASSGIFYGNQATFVIGAGVIHQAFGPYAAIEDISLNNLHIYDPTGPGVYMTSARGTFGSLEHISMQGLKINLASIAIELGEYISNAFITDTTILRCENGIISTNPNVLRLRVTNSAIHQVLGGVGIRIENGSSGTCTGNSVTNDGTNGQTGIQLRKLQGVWRVGNNFSTGGTTDYSYSENGSATATSEPSFP